MLPNRELEELLPEAADDLVSPAVTDREILRHVPKRSETSEGKHPLEKAGACPSSSGSHRRRHTGNSAACHDHLVSVENREISRRFLEVPVDP
jgi:hypothetical protein